MKKIYDKPKAEILQFAEKDVITSSGNLFDWETPEIDLGGEGFYWSEDGSVFSVQAPK